MKLEIEQLNSVMEDEQLLLVLSFCGQLAKDRLLYNGLKCYPISIVTDSDNG